MGSNLKVNYSLTCARKQQLIFIHTICIHMLCPILEPERKATVSINLQIESYCRTSTQDKVITHQTLRVQSTKIMNLKTDKLQEATW